MQTSIRSTTDSTQHGDLPRTENDGGIPYHVTPRGNGYAPAWGSLVMMMMNVCGRHCICSFHVLPLGVINNDDDDDDDDDDFS